MKIWNVIKSFVVGRGSKTTKKGVENLAKNLIPGNKNVENFAKIKQGLKQEKTTTKGFKDLLKELIPGKNRDVESFADIKEKIENYRQERKLDKNERINEITKEKINLGNLGSRSKEKQKFFFTATQKYWENAPIDKRYETIVKNLGVENIQEAWDMVFNDPKNKVYFKEYLKEIDLMKDKTTSKWKDGERIYQDFEISPDKVNYNIVKK